MRSRLLIGCLLTGTVVLDIVLWRTTDFMGQDIFWSFTLLALVFAQVNLTAAWFVMSRWNVLLRIAIMLAVLTLLAALPADQSPIGYEGYLGAFAVVAAVTAAPLLILRLRGWMLVRPGPESGMGPAALPPQFTLAAMLSSITGIGLLLAATQFMEINTDVVRLGVISLLFALLLFVVLGAVMLDRPALGIRILAVTIVIPAMGFAWGNLEASNWVWEHVWLVCDYTLYCAACLAVVHVAGYRLRRAGTN